MEKDLTLSKRKPLLSASIWAAGVEHRVDVYILAFLRVRIQIQVDGEYLAGDKFKVGAAA